MSGVESKEGGEGRKEGRDRERERERGGGGGKRRERGGGGREKESFDSPQWSPNHLGFKLSGGLMLRM